MSLDKLILVAVVAAFLLGPTRLPVAAQWLAKAVRSVRDVGETAKTRAREELGDDFDVEWRRLDPRQYDPRRIIRDALLDDHDESSR